MRMKRRTLLKTAMAAGVAAAVPDTWSQKTDEAWAKTWDAALATLAGNVKLVPQFDHPVLFEGSVYQGTWQECGPHESLAMRSSPTSCAGREGNGGNASPLEIAKNTHRAFFTLQREDGQLPAAVKLSGMSWGQIQMVVPIAATGWEIAQKANDETFLSEAYNACSRWDAWLRRYRDTRGTGLVEAFCTYDTGQDNSPRWAGVSDACPDNDAKKFSPGQSVPRLCPDLSATVFGAQGSAERHGYSARQNGRRAEVDRRCRAHPFADPQEAVVRGGRKLL